MARIVLFVYPHLPHYRTAVFQDIGALLSRSGMLMKVAGSHKPHNGIKSIQDLKTIGKYSFGWLPLKNFKVTTVLGEFILWQMGVWRSIISNDVRSVVLLEGIQFLPNWVYLFLGYCVRKPVYIWGHGLYGNETRIKQWLRFAQLGLSGGAFVYGKRSFNLIKKNLAHLPVVVVYNSYCRVLPIINQAGAFVSKQSPLRIMFLGRLTAIKQVDLAIKALGLLNPSEYHFTIVGDGPMKDSLLHLAREMRLKNIEFHNGVYDDAQLGYMFERCDVLVSPGNTGLNCIHALSYGVPVVTHDSYEWQMPEVEAIIPHFNGVFFKRGSINDLSRSLTEVRNLLRDGKLTANDCRKVVADRYNSHFQARIFSKFFEGSTNEPIQI